MAFPGIGQHDGLEMASWIVGSEAQEGVWDGEEGQRIKNTEAVMEVLGVVQSGKSR